MMLLVGYKSKKELKTNIGQPLMYEETSMFGAEYVSNGKIVGAYRPQLTGGGGREFFATVTLKDDLIVKVV